MSHCSAPLASVLKFLLIAKNRFTAMMRFIAKYYSWLHTYTLSWAVADSTLVQEWKARNPKKWCEEHSLNDKSAPDHKYFEQVVFAVIIQPVLLLSSKKVFLSFCFFHFSIDVIVIFFLLSSVLFMNDFIFVKLFFFAPIILLLCQCSVWGGHTSYWLHDFSLCSWAIKISRSLPFVRNWSYPLRNSQSRY